MTNPSVSECVLEMLLVLCLALACDKCQLFSEEQLDHVMLPWTLGPSTLGKLP